MNVSQIYDGEPVEMKIELEKETANWGGLKSREELPKEGVFLRATFVPFPK